MSSKNQKDENTLKIELAKCFAEFLWDEFEPVFPVDSFFTQDDAIRLADKQATLALNMILTGSGQTAT